MKEGCRRCCRLDASGSPERMPPPARLQVGGLLLISTTDAHQVHHRNAMYILCANEAGKARFAPHAGIELLTVQRHVGLAAID